MKREPRLVARKEITMNHTLCHRAMMSLLAVAVGLSIQTALAVTLNQVDTFQTGTTLDWSGNSSPTNIPDGGREGALDGFLQISSIKSHLATFNQAQWVGDYTAAGIEAIELDMNHLAGDPVSVRLYVLDSIGRAFASTVTKPIADSTWKRYQFGLAATDLTNLDGGTLDATLTGVSKILIRYDIAATPTPTGGGQVGVTATLGLDNIRAITYGDVNYDGVVNIFDINLVSSHWNEPGPMGDANADGVVNIFDINLISANWTPAGAATVPEPAALVLAVIGAVGLLPLKRHSHVPSRLGD
jgi:Dockerin type I domain